MEFEDSISSFDAKHPHLGPELTGQGAHRGFEFGFKTDIYSLGLLVYKLIHRGILYLKLTKAMNQAQFRDQPTRAQWTEMSQRADFSECGVLWRSRAEDPDDRPTLDELEAWLMRQELAA